MFILYGYVVGYFLTLGWLWLLNQRDNVYKKYLSLRTPAGAAVCMSLVWPVVFVVTLFLCDPIPMDTINKSWNKQRILKPRQHPAKR